jgi:hypothetical protein
MGNFIRKSGHAQEHVVLFALMMGTATVLPLIGYTRCYVGISR